MQDFRTPLRKDERKNKFIRFFNFLGGDLNVFSKCRRYLDRPPPSQITTYHAQIPMTIVWDNFLNCGDSFIRFLKVIYCFLFYFLFHPNLFFSFFFSSIFFISLILLSHSPSFIINENDKYMKSNLCHLVIMSQNT